MLFATSSSKNRQHGSFPMFLNLLTCISVVMATSNEGQGIDDIEIKPSCAEKQDCPVRFEEADLKKRLTELEYQVTQEKGTERLVKIGFHIHLG